MSFTAEHVTRTQVIHLAAPPSQAFPLFGPVGERAWTEGWNPTMLYPLDGSEQADAVFTVLHPTQGESIWAMPIYDPADCHLTYVQVTPGSRVSTIDIRCQEAPGGTTHASVAYTFTALTDQGNAFIERFTEAHYQEMMAAWERAINYYLAHGHALQHH